MKVLVTYKIPEPGMQILKDNIDKVIVNPHDINMTYEEIRAEIPKVDGILTMLANKIDRKIINAASNLKVISNYAVGYNNIDVEYAKSRNIIVTNTPGVLTNATADVTWALILSVARRVVESDRFVRDGKFTGWAPELLLGHELSGKTIGIVGAGRIGQAVGRRAAGFDMKILYTANSPKPGFEKQTGAQKVELQELLKESDIISLHVPLTENTKYLINKNEFALMKANAILINTARGPVINESELATALLNRQIAGAGLDVYEKEPTVHPGLKSLPNVVLLPHTGSATTETRSKMAEIAAKNLAAVLKGKPPEFPV